MKTVLVVEDTEDLRELFLMIIRAHGYRAFGAEHGKQALELLDSLGNEPCLILVDLMMPVMDGAALLNALRATHRVASLPVVIVSANSPEAATEGARKVVKKPVSADVIAQLVHEFCGPP